jgi:hypothetical protein
LIEGNEIPPGAKAYRIVVMTGKTGQLGGHIRRNGVKG